MVFYKKIPIEITDEEYNKLLELSEPIKDDESSKGNTVATVLTVFAWIVFIGGFIAGIILMEDEVTLGFVSWIAAFIEGIFILGFAEIIKLLNQIKNK